MTHVVHQGDCRELLAQVPESSVDLVLADPPYRIRSWQAFGSKHDRTYGVEPIEYSSWLPACRRVLKDSGSILVFETPMNMFALKEEMEKAGFIVQPPLAWFVSFRKSHPRRGYYNSHWEPISWGTKTDKWYFDSKPLRGKGSRWGGDVFEAASVVRARVPGQKPLKLIQRQVEVHVPPGGVVLDPFAGSGTTALAALATGRSSISMEIDAELCEYIRKALGETP
jgi:DNA modification methylase